MPDIPKSKFSTLLGPCFNRKLLVSVMPKAPSSKPSTFTSRVSSSPPSGRDISPPPSTQPRRTASAGRRAGPQPFPLVWQIQGHLAQRRTASPDPASTCSSNTSFETVTNTVTSDDHVSEAEEAPGLVQVDDDYDCGISQAQAEADALRRQLQEEESSSDIQVRIGGPGETPAALNALLSPLRLVPARAEIEDSERVESDPVQTENVPGPSAPVRRTSYTAPSTVLTRRQSLRFRAVTGGDVAENQAQLEADRDKATINKLTQMLERAKGQVKTKNQLVKSLRADLTAAQEGLSDARVVIEHLRNDYRELESKLKDTANSCEQYRERWLNEVQFSKLVVDQLPGGRDADVVKEATARRYHVSRR
ncbi:hypothetical protein CC2G_011075 [Coprinopsis cinerea AmutBmut pab1-1]|nr:hypothetical protein CC2G_011075 [Coprinopsis cinerea AmutBmut pab1-1]